jgi:hypothetical protein
MLWQGNAAEAAQKMDGIPIPIISVSKLRMALLSKREQLLPVNVEQESIPAQMWAAAVITRSLPLQTVK